MRYIVFMKIIKKLYDENQKNLIKNLAKEAKITEFTAEILYGRGFETALEITKFLTPFNQTLKSPFTLSGMEDAVKRIISAKENGETIVIFGDYDADGICATTVLYNALKIFGVNVYTVIPERDNGYGLSVSVLEEVLETYYPDLIITVDCGISAKAEVEYLSDLGVDVIVTDHHEFPAELPNTIIVSTKTPNQEYDFQYLSGAGVAYKLSSALIGDEADGFLDLVAVATVADSMPLQDENRVLVYRGIELIKSGNCHPAIRLILLSCGAKEVTASTLAYTVAPRINAAGRMGDAYSALELFLTDNASLRDELVEKLNRYNVDRQLECENLYKSAKEKLKETTIKSAIVLYDKTWKSGLLGIVASRLCDEYNFPTILFTEVDGVLRGSARSVDSVNVFDAISKLSKLLVEFGGHAQAAGISIKLENFDEFSIEFNKIIESDYDLEIEKTVEVDGEITSPISLKTARELNMLEPFGTGNKKPLFLLKAGKTQSRRLKEGSNHLSVKTEQMELLYFNGANSLELLNDGVCKNLLVECGLSIYNGKEYVKGFVKKIITDFSVTNTLTVNCFKKAINGLKYGVFNAKSDEKAFQEELKNLNSRGFSKLFIVTNPENLLKYKELQKLEINLYSLTTKGGKNAVLVGADVNAEDISSYDKIILVDRPLGDIYLHKHQTLIASELNAFSLDLIYTDVDLMREDYKFIASKKDLLISVETLIETAENPYQTAFSTQVFLELEFISDNVYITINNKVKKSLLDSKIYQGVLSIKNA